MPSRCIRVTAAATLLSIACGAVIVSPPLVAADGLIGQHFFPSTLTVDDPFVAEELGFTLLDVKTPGRRPFPRGRALTVDGVYAKTLTPSLGVSLAGEFLHLDPDDRPSQSGFANPTVQVKYEIVESAVREALVSAAVAWDIGGIGDRSVGAPTFDVVTPALLFAKAFGDLPEAGTFARPFALTGRLGAAIPTRATTRTFDPASGTRTALNPTVLQWGVAIEYSLPYLQDVVGRAALPRPFSRLVPLVEFSLETPLNGADKNRTFGTVNPGVAWLAGGDRFQITLEAAIPLNDRTGSTVGVRASLDFFLNRMFPSSRLFRPLF